MFAMVAHIYVECTLYINNSNMYKLIYTCIKL